MSVSSPSRWRLRGAAGSGFYSWVVLVVIMLAQASSGALLQGLASIGPVFREHYELSLGELGLVLGSPTAGLVVSLLLWGVATDRWPERVVISTGLSSAALFLVLAGLANGLGALCLTLALAGSFVASVNVAGGRAVIRWFPTERRGLAMGLRQASTPLGAAVAAILLPLGVSHLSVSFGLYLLAGCCVFAAGLVVLLVREPDAETSGPPAKSPPSDGAGPGENRSRRRAFGGVVLASTCLVICQTVFLSFVVTILHDERGLDLRTAGIVFATSQLLGALARVLVGTLSDRRRDRIGPLRLVSAVTTIGLVLLAAALGAELPLRAVIPLMILVGATTISWNGVAVTAAGELAPPGRTGTSLGIQGTANYLVASLTPLLFGTLVMSQGYAFALAIVALPAVTSTLLLSGRNRALAEQAISKE